MVRFLQDIFTNAWFEYYIINNYALRDVILPFFAIYFTIYLALGATVLKEKPTKTVIAASVALIVVVPHVLRWYPPHLDPIEIAGRGMFIFGIIALVAMLIILVLGWSSVRPEQVLQGSYGSVLLLMINIFTYIYAPEIFPLVLILSILKVLQRILIPGGKGVSFFFILAMAMVFVARFGLGWPRQTPAPLIFLTEPGIQTAATVVFFFMIIVQFIFHRSEAG